MSNSSGNGPGLGKVLLGLAALVVAVFCLCLMPIGMVGVYYDRKALAEADREWASGNRAVAVEKYRPLLKNSVFDDADKKRIAERVKEFESGVAVQPAAATPPVDPVTRLQRKKVAIERVLGNARTDQQQIADELRNLNVRTAADLGGTQRGRELAKRLPGLVAEIQWIEGKIAELDGAILDEKRYARQAELQQAGLTPAEQTERAERIKRLEEDAGVPPAELTPLDLEAAVTKTLSPPTSPPVAPPSPPSSAPRTAMPPPPLPLKPSEQTPDRRVAVWVLRVGGSVKVNVDGQRTEWRSPANTSERSFTMAEVYLKDNSQVTSDALIMLKGLEQLGCLDVWGSSLSDDGMRVVGTLTGLKRLTIGTCQRVTAAGLARVGELSRLEELNIAGVPVNTEAARQIGRLTRLRVLLTGGCQISNGDFAPLSGLMALETLGIIDNFVITDGVMMHLRHLKGLRSIKAKGTKLTDRAVKQYLPNCEVAR